MNMKPWTEIRLCEFVDLSKVLKTSIFSKLKAWKSLCK